MDIQDLSGRKDEIGDLSGALRRMTHALWEGMEETEKFAADVSHELKTPLASTYSAAETAIREGNPAKRRKLMQIVLDDVRRLNRLIDSVADLSSLGAQFSRAETRPVDFRATIEACVDTENPPRADFDGRAGGAVRCPRPRRATHAGRPKPDRQCPVVFSRAWGRKAVACA